MSQDGPALITKPIVSVSGAHVNLSLWMMCADGFAYAPNTRSALTPAEARAAARELERRADEAEAGCPR